MWYQEVSLRPESDIRSWMGRVKLWQKLAVEPMKRYVFLYTVKPESKLNQITDMIGYNIYFGWYYGEMRDYDNYLDQLHEKCPGMPLGVSEYGVDANPELHSANPMVRDYSEEYQALHNETVYPIFKSKDYM